MKRYLILLCLVIAYMVSAAPALKFQDEDITAGETIIGEVTVDGEFTKSIRNEDLKFYEGRKEVFFESEIYFYNGSYYFYVYTTRTGEFSLEIRNVLYEENEVLGSANLEKSFGVNEIENASGVLSIKPGVVYLKNEPKITVYNVGESPVNFTYLKNETELSAGESKEIYYTPTKDFSYIEIESYKDFSVPVISTGRNNTETNASNENNLKVSPTVILVNIFAEEESNTTMEFFNFGDEKITDIEFFSNIEFIEFPKLETLDAREALNESVYFSPQGEGRFSDTVNITYKQAEKNYRTSFYVDLFVFKNGENITNATSADETCEEKNGKVCGLEEMCENSSVWTKGGVYCCLGNCKVIEEVTEENYYWVYGVLIFAVIAIFGFMIYTKYKKTGPKNSEEKLREISQRYEGRTR